MANQWALILVIIFGVSACAGFYTIISSYMGILAVEDEAHKAEVIAAGTEKLREQAAAQEQHDNLVKYGCANPEVKTGLVMCP